MSRDLRTLGTNKTIQNTFLKLLARKPMSKITVAELARESQIGQNTFYLHYQEIFNLKEQLTDQLLQELEIFLDEIPFLIYKDTLTQLTLKMLNYFDTYRQSFKVLVFNKDNLDSQEKLKKIFFQAVVNEKSAPLSEMIAAHFCVNGLVDLLNEWLTGKITENSKDMMEALIQIMK